MSNDADKYEKQSWCDVFCTSKTYRVLTYDNGDINKGDYITLAAHETRPCYAVISKRKFKKIPNTIALDICKDDTLCNWEKKIYFNDILMASNKKIIENYLNIDKPLDTPEKKLWDDFFIRTRIIRGWVFLKNGEYIDNSKEPYDKYHALYINLGDKDLFGIYRPLITQTSYTPKVIMAIMKYCKFPKKYIDSFKLKIELS
jgi:hypothetical protein